MVHLLCKHVQNVFTHRQLYFQNCEREVISYLSKKFQGKVAKLEIVPKEDLDLVSFVFSVLRQHLSVTYYITKKKCQSEVVICIAWLHVALVLLAWLYVLKWCFLLLYYCTVVSCNKGQPSVVSLFLVALHGLCFVFRIHVLSPFSCNFVV